MSRESGEKANRCKTVQGKRTEVEIQGEEKQGQQTTFGKYHNETVPLYANKKERKKNQARRIGSSSKPAWVTGIREKEYEKQIAKE